MLDHHPEPLTAPACGTYLLDPQRSRVRYTGKHMLGLGTVHATFSVRDGELRIGDGGQTLSTDVTVDAASFHSGSSKRDRDVRSRGLLDIEQYPTSPLCRRASPKHLKVGSFRAPSPRTDTRYQSPYASTDSQPTPRSFTCTGGPEAWTAPHSASPDHEDW